MKKILWCLTAVLAALVFSGTQSAAALKHRYSFETGAEDSVGTAHGTLEGGAWVISGSLDLDPGIQSYVDLPAGILNGFPAVTIEAWVSFGVNANWARLFDFGDTNPENNLGRNYLFFTPRSGPNDTRLVISDADPGFNNEQMANFPGALDEREDVHVVAVVDPVNSQMRIYIDGELAGVQRNLVIPLSSLVNNFSYIGRSLYPDPYFNGQIHEFRIYDHAMGIAEAVASGAAGPDEVGTVTAGELAGLTIEAETELIGGTLNPVRVFADYQNFQRLEVTSEPGAVLESADSTIVQVTPDGFIRAVAPGQTTLTARFGGSEAMLNVQVQEEALPPAVLKHRYSFAGDAFSFGPVTDSVSSAHGMLEGFASYTGDGQVELAENGYVDLPNGIISALTDASFETWVTFAGEPGAWQRIFDFGTNTAGEGEQGTGTTYLFLTPRMGTTGPMRFAATLTGGGGEAPQLTAPSTLPAGVESHIVVTYNFSGREAKLFLNGRLIVSGPVQFPLTEINDVNNWLGRSNWPDAGFAGLFNEFRIYDGALTELQVTLNNAAGPDALPPEPGDLISLSLEISPTDLVAGGLPAQLSLKANFSAIQGVEVTTLSGAQFVSSAPGVASVSANGVVTPLTGGQTIVTASFGGQEAALTLNVTGLETPLELLHRYSFNEAAGATVAPDLVGNADGQVRGTANFTGDGRLNLPGGAANTDAGYVDLPNGMISSLPPAVTFEAWFTWRGGPAWQRIFDFGSNQAGEDAQGTGSTYLFMTPQSGPGTFRAAFTLASGAGENPVLNGPALPQNTEVHVALVYDSEQGIARLYRDGERVATQPVVNPLSELDDINNWLGRSNWPDAFFNGQFNEFRIWSGAMTDAQVAERRAAGPDAIDAPVEAPALTVARSANEIVIRGPAAANDFRLQQTAALEPDAVWTDVPQQPSVVAGNLELSAPMTESARFYRLIR
jgi:hypothetical protein